MTTSFALARTLTLFHHSLEAITRYVYEMNVFCLPVSVSTPGYEESRVGSIAYSPQGGLLVSGSGDCIMRLWDVETGECRQISKVHTEDIVIVVYSPQGNQVASASMDESVRIWDMRAGECLHTLASHTGGVTSVVYSSSGDHIVSGSKDATVRLWDVTSGLCRAVIPSMDTHITSIAWNTTSDDNCFAIGYEDGSVLVWQVIEYGDECHIRLRWRPVNGELVLKDTVIQDVHGLSQPNRQLLHQRGAVSDPFSEACMKIQATKRKVSKTLLDPSMIAILLLIIISMRFFDPSTIAKVLLMIIIMVLSTYLFVRMARYVVTGTVRNQLLTFSNTSLSGYNPSTSKYDYR
ncbi:MAG: WD40-repeat-containing domain protein [Benniella sp.]|nr:MAG: WD40-repeat-containing domain protein [Benniella sp.]